MNKVARAGIGESKKRIPGGKERYYYVNQHLDAFTVCLFLFPWLVPFVSSCLDVLPNFEVYFRVSD